MLLWLPMIVTATALALAEVEGKLGKRFRQIAFIFKKALIWKDSAKIRNVEKYLTALKSSAISVLSRKYFHTCGSGRKLEI